MAKSERRAVGEVHLSAPPQTKPALPQIDRVRVERNRLHGNQTMPCETGARAMRLAIARLAA